MTATVGERTSRLHATITNSRCHQTGLIATASGDDCIRVFQEDQSAPDRRNQPQFSLAATAEQAHSQDVNGVAWNPKEPGLLASCSDDGVVKIWRYKEE